MERTNTWAHRSSPDPDAMPADAAQFGYQRIPRVEKSDRVLTHFDAVAAKYDLMNTVLSLGIHHVWKRKAIGFLKLQSGDRVLDVCGGTGDLARLAAGRVSPAGWICLYDFNARMMAAGREKASTHEEAAIAYALGDAEHLALRAGSFDAAMVGFGIRNLSHMESGFEEMYRILRPGGKMLCLEFSRPAFGLFRWMYDVYSFHIMPALGALIAGNRQGYLHLAESIRTFPGPETLNTILEKIGFADVSYRRLTNGIAVIHLARKGPSNGT